MRTQKRTKVYNALCQKGLNTPRTRGHPRTCTDTPRRGFGRVSETAVTVQTHELASFAHPCSSPGLPPS